MPLSLTNVNVGAAPNDGTGDPARTAFQTINTNNGLIETEVDGKIDASIYNAQSVVVSILDNTPVVAALSTNQLVGREGGNIGALTATQVRSIINVEDGADVTDATNVNAAGAMMNSDWTPTQSMMFADGAGSPTAVLPFNYSFLSIPGSGDDPQFKIVGAGQILGRNGSGDLQGHDPEDIRTMINGTVLDPTPDSDHSYSGNTAELVAGESITFGEVCFIHTDGKVYQSDADNAGEIVMLMCMETSISADATGTFLLPGGFVRDDSWNWTVGSANPLYNSNTNGAMTQTAPVGTGDRVQLVGVPTHADRIWFNPSPEWTII